ncbi:4'-phosphopantetheinyl transferase family protein [Pedobacter cryotolerans]|uniref:4-phosphopantetheinyl transferase family protein n=1 Tax=Pedobacter cryotolerans TaxID=2571270 RepID=A0A4U1CBR0_9SPHI|nr:4'-phosphopantetheinyl transferase superfamily protein [Pedobacter cryotolerans]TKC03465.1 4-phosphopantetheinyl transferase family protein [Pedobacter cryotolerans]
MIGNDIVDLAKAAKDSNWKRKGYLKKVFTLGEQELIFSSKDLNVIVWQFWSMKEAAYKAIGRNTNLLFNPLLFNCALNGEVDYMEERFYSKTVMDSTNLHTVAANSQQYLDKICTHLLPNTTDYLSAFNLKHCDLELKKDKNGLPLLLTKQDGLKHLASVSHHGHYLAVAYLNCS